MMFRCLAVALIFLFVLVVPRAALALEPDELLLLVSKRAPVSRQLAEYYAQQRHVPPGRIVALDVPPTDDCTVDQYERNVVPVVRDFLRQNHLENKVTCLVTFLGLPLRIATRSLTPGERGELADLQNEVKRVDSIIVAQLQVMESLATQLDANFKPSAGTTVEDLGRRIDAVTAAIRISARTVNDPELRQKLSAKLLPFVQVTGGRVQFYEEIYPIAAHRPGISQTESDQWAQLQTEAIKAQADIRPLLDRRYDSAARLQVRQLVRDHFGLLRYSRLLHGMIEYLSTDEAGAAFDSELSLLWWNYYPRGKWVSNLLFYDTAARPKIPVTMMVCRLDAPDEGQVRDIIITSLKAEHEGLHGRVVCDSRGLIPDKANNHNSYADYDQTIRNLANLVREKTKLAITIDDKPDVLPANSVKDVALYVGWYSLMHYIPACHFNPGAVGYHIASMEMTSLRDPKNTGWCRGLLNDGISATLGPVAEPYLASFPNADDFFPLLMTGKLTLAEVFWRTERMASWQTCLIGDPLYTPYKVNPALAVSDLPERLRPALRATTRPTTQPAL